MKKFYALLLVVIIGNYLSAQTTFTKYFGSIEHGWIFGYSVQQTRDSGYVAVGISLSPTKVCLVKTNMEGDTLWTKKLGDSISAHNVRQTTDGGYVIAGAIAYAHGNALLIKTDAAGNIAWAKSYGGIDNDGASIVQQTIDGGYVIGGYSASFGAGNSDFYLVKTDSIGNLQWTKTYGGENMEAIYSMQQTLDTGYVMTGLTYSFGAEHGGAYVVKTNKYGDTLWTKMYRSSDQLQDISMQQLSDGNYIMSISLVELPIGEHQKMDLVKIDSNGNPIWTKGYYNSTDYIFIPHSIKETQDAGYIISGIASDSAGYSIGLAKTDSSGITEWAKKYSYPFARGEEVQPTMDGGYIITALSGMPGINASAMFLIKTGADGNSCNSTDIILTDTLSGLNVISPATIVSSGGTVSTPVILMTRGMEFTTVCTTVGIQEEENKNADNIVVAPNPSNGKFSFSGMRSDSKVEIYDITGRLIFEAIIKNNFYDVDLNEKDNGIYIYRITEQNKKVQKGKIVLDHNR